MLFQDVVVGAGLGSVVGRLIVHRSERRRGEEWTAMRVRQVEAKWMVGGIAMGLIGRVLFG
jgi:hypothetical protein